MARKRQKMVQLRLAFPEEGRGEALTATERGTELAAAEQAIESPARVQRVMEEVVQRDNLIRAWKRVKSNGGSQGIDGMKVKELMDYLRENWATIREQLEQGTYKPQPVKRVEIPKPSGGKLHRYPDPPQAAWRCYPLEEIVAEKLRALLQSRLRLQERGWGTSRVCRDYYDLWHLLSRGTLDVTLLPELLAHKCALRQVTFASVADFLAPELQAVARVEWEHQLLPFVPDAPSADHVLDELIGLLAALPKACPSPGWPTD